MLRSAPVGAHCLPPPPRKQDYLRPSSTCSADSSLEVAEDPNAIVMRRNEIPDAIPDGDDDLGTGLVLRIASAPLADNRVPRFGREWVRFPRRSASVRVARRSMQQFRAMAHYRKPGSFTKHVFNRSVAGITRLGISVWGSRILRVKGRRSGEWRSNPVNLLNLDQDRYLVAPRGETDWVKNLRAAGSGELLLGRRTEPFHAVELPDDDKPPILRAYLKRWKAEVGVFFDGVSATSADEDVAREAQRHPVFRIEKP
jgi:deazaflavin-dependent oxidoreductase (nitroreductase family)